MQFWVLNKDFRAISLIDRFCSLIWTERFRGYGEMEFILSPEDSSAAGADVDYYLQTSDSEYVMILEDFEIITDQEAGDTIKFTGRSLESILERRIIWKQTVLSGSFQDGIEKLLNENIITPSDPNRAIPNFVFMKRYDEAITSLKIDAQFTGDNLYDAILKLCAAQKIGFKINLVDAGQAFDKDCYGDLGEGTRLEVVSGNTCKIVKDATLHDRVIFVPCRGDKTYTIERGMTGYNAKVFSAHFDGIPKLDTNVSTNGIKSFTGKKTTFTTAANHNYICYQAYCHDDYPYDSTLETALTDMSMIAVMPDDYPQSELAFKLIYGIDRTVGQTDVPRILFSPKFENVGESNYISSNKLYKSVTLVAGEDKGEERKTVEVENDEGVLAGLERRELYTDARDIQSEVGEIFDEDNANYLDNTLMDDVSGTLVEATGFKTVVIPAQANTKYKLKIDTFEIGSKIRIGGFKELPEVGSAVEDGQIWALSVKWDDDPIGQYGKGNIDLYNRPLYFNEDGSVSTVRSMSFKEGKQEVLIPTIVFKNGNPTLLSDSEAKQWYKNTGEYLGKFDTVPQANKYAEKLHAQQELIYPELADELAEDMSVEFEIGDVDVNYIAITVNDATYEGHYMPVASCDGSDAVELDTDANYSHNIQIEIITELSTPETDGFIVGTYATTPKLNLKYHAKTSEDDQPVPFVEWNSHTLEGTHEIEEGANSYVVSWNGEDNILSLDYGNSRHDQLPHDPDHDLDPEWPGRAWGSSKFVVFGGTSQKVSYVQIRKDDSPHCYLVPVIDTAQGADLQPGLYDLIHRKFYPCLGASATSIDWEAAIKGLSIEGTMTEYGYGKQLYERGKEDLSECKRSVTFDGDVQPTVNYIYGKDYFIGDVVTIENKYGFEVNERVTELIRSEDPQGYTEVPTFTSLDKEEDET